MRFFKRIPVMIILIISVLIMNNVHAQTLIASGNCGTNNNLSWALRSDSVLTIRGSGDVFANTPANYPWYTHNDKIKTVILGDSVTGIGDWIFSYSPNITSVTIPNSVTTIGKYAFQDCISLTSIVIPNSLTSIDNQTFFNCSSLKSVIIPNSVISIGNSVFNGCTVLDSVMIPNSVISIGNSAFWTCRGLTFITLGSGLKSIGSNAFWNCTALPSITIPDSVISIGYRAFQTCTTLTSITIPSSVIDIQEGAFWHCSSLTSFHVDSNNPRYSSYDDMIYNKSKDTIIACPSGKFGTMAIPNNAISIAEYAFYTCNKLNSIIIPNSVVSIGYRAFSFCSALQSITIHAANPPVLGGDVFSFVSANIPVYIPCQSYDKYSSDLGWSCFANLIVNGIPTEDTTFYTAIKCYNAPYSDDNFTTPIYNVGNYCTTLLNSTGCDSIICLILLEKSIPQLCMISVDENYYNEIVWKQEEDVVAYNIYREGNQGGQYDLVASINSNNSNRWVDTASNANIRSYRYKIAGIDTCNSESTLSDPHKTMHLTINSEVNNSWNLIWTPYEGTEYSTYNIYRSIGDTLNSLTLIGTMPSGNTSFSDFAAPSGYVYYLVEVVLDEPCILTKSRSSIKSNVATNNPNGTTGIIDVKMDDYSFLRVYPNPTTGQLTIESGELDISTVEIFDITGKTIRTFNSLVNNTIDVFELQNGVYFITFYTEGQRITKKFVKN